MLLSIDALAKLCISRAWDNDVDDRSRWLLEKASRYLEKTARRSVRLAHQLEVAQAEIERLTAACAAAQPGRRES